MVYNSFNIDLFKGVSVPHGVNVDMKKYLLIFVSALLIMMVTGCGAKEGISTDPSEEAAGSSLLSDDEALSAVKNYCYESNPDLKDIEKDGEYELYWEVESGDEKEIVVLFRSYTAAEIRYHIDRDSGDTYVTEFVPGITEKEEKTDESFNIRDYM